jgi:hypothetical protein
MNDDRTDAGSQGTSDEPALTEKNSRTIRGEEVLEKGGRVESNLDRETSTRTKSGVIPSSYGAAGGTTDATEEGGDGTGI